MPSAFDAWAEAGCEGWSAANVLPLYDAIEDDTNFGIVGKRLGGKLPVWRMPEARWGAVDIALRDAALAAGFAREPNLNAPDGEGISCSPINLRDGVRITTNDAYLEPVRDRANLEIRGEAMVDRVLLDGRRARGVRVRFGNGAWEEVAAREVVLCAGAIHSPCLLMRSGSGPASALRTLGIEVLHDLPAVRQHFMDQPILRATLALKPGYRAQSDDARHTNCCVTYSSGVGGGGERDMMVVAYNHRGLVASGAAPVGGIGVALFEAFSRGEVRLASADPEAQPTVEENMLDHPDDRLRMRDGVRRLAALCALPAIARIADAITFGDSALSIAEAAALPDDRLDAVMLEEASDTQHAAGTCRMTAHEDPRGVVDPEMKVGGVAGLRVADASIMPADCRANLHFPCVMIGEMAAKRMRAVASP